MAHIELSRSNNVISSNRSRAALVVPELLGRPSGLGVNVPAQPEEQLGPHSRPRSRLVLVRIGAGLVCHPNGFKKRDWFDGFGLRVIGGENTYGVIKITKNNLQ